MKLPLLFILFTIGLLSCGPDEYPSFRKESVEGYRPVYADSIDLTIQILDARPIQKAGKIYSYGDLLLVNELGQGLHVYNNADPRNPQNLFFLNVPGNQDMAIKEGILYADNFSDLVALEVSSDTVVILKRLQGVMSAFKDFPPGNDVYFECIDESRGPVAAWELTTLKNPNCYRP